MAFERCRCFSIDIHNDWQIDLDVILSKKKLDHVTLSDTSLQVEKRVECNSNRICVVKKTKQKKNVWFHFVYSRWNPIERRSMIDTYSSISPYYTRIAFSTRILFDCSCLMLKLSMLISNTFCPTHAVSLLEGQLFPLELDVDESAALSDHRERERERERERVRSRDFLAAFPDFLKTASFVIKPKNLAHTGWRVVFRLVGVIWLLVANERKWARM